MASLLSTLLQRRSMDDRSFIAGQAAGSIGLPAFWEASSDSDAHRPRRRRRRPLLVSSMPNANLTTIKSVRDDDDVATPGPSVSCRNGVGTVQYRGGSIYASIGRQHSSCCKNLDRSRGSKLPGSSLPSDGVVPMIASCEPNPALAEDQSS